MTSLPFSILRRVRIRGGEFGASARAMHRKAAFENVSSATIERKTMSTKTTFKRIALVAVAALAIGGLTAVSAQAVAGNVTCTVAYSGTGAACNGLAGPANTVTIANSSATLRQYLTISGGTFTGGATTATLTVSGGLTPSITVPTPAAGTITVTAYAETGSGTGLYSVSSTDSVAVTVLAAAPGTTYDHSTAFISSTTGTAPAADDAASLLAASSAYNGSTPAARIAVNQYALADTTTVSSGYAKAVSVAITGAGQVDTQATGATRSSTAGVVAGGTYNSDFYVFANGVAGTATITISVNSVVVSTKTYVFYGSFKTFKLGTPSKTVIGVGTTGTVALSGLDSNGNAAALSTVVVSSASTSVATVAYASGVITVTGVAPGTSVITVTDSASAPTTTATFTATVGKATAKTVTLTTDKTSYAAGEKITLTVTAVGSDGTAIGDNPTFQAFSSAGLTSNVALQNFPAVTGTGGSGVGVAIVGGVGTYTFYAPLSDGTVTVSATEGTGIDHVAADSTTAAVLSTSFDVSNPGSSAAVDAANAATDAANYAADAADAATTAAQEATAAAQAAQDSADAATAAVVALGLRVDTLMASVRAQLTSLSNLLVRLIKKAHA